MESRFINEVREGMTVPKQKLFVHLRGEGKSYVGASEEDACSELWVYVLLLHGERPQSDFSEEVFPVSPNAKEEDQIKSHYQNIASKNIPVVVVMVVMVVLYVK